MIGTNKQVVFLGFVSALLLLSCKKKYDCECKRDVTVNAGVANTEPSYGTSYTSYTYKTRKKSDAQTSCTNDHAQHTETSSPPTVIDITCTIK